jgi:hypothetical protein
MRNVIYIENDGWIFFLCEDRKTQQTQHTQLKVIKDIDFKEIYLCWVCVGLLVFCVGFGFSGGRTMIEEIEELMQHWARQHCQVGDGAGLGSPMATIMQWGGSAPRGTPGSRDLLMAAGGGMDHAATEVAAALAQLERQSEKGAQLATLARNRYLPQPAYSVRSQLQLLGLREDADRTYRNWVHRLHQQVQLILTVRSATTRGLDRRSGALETNLTRASTSRRARAC